MNVTIDSTVRHAIFSMDNNTPDQYGKPVEAGASFIYSNVMITFFHVSDDPEGLNLSTKVAVVNPINEDVLSEQNTVEDAILWVNHQNSPIRNMIEQAIKGGGFIRYQDQRIAPVDHPTMIIYSQQYLDGIVELARLGIELPIVYTDVDYSLDEKGNPPLSEEGKAILTEIAELQARLDKLTARRDSGKISTDTSEWFTLLQPIADAFKPLQERLMADKELFRECNEAFTTLLTSMPKS